MRANSPSFVAEFPLQTTAADEATLATRLEAARQLYNASLGESLRLLALMRESKQWQRARAMPKTCKGKRNKERSRLFKEVVEQHGFFAGTIQKHAQRCRDQCWIGDHLGSHDTQTVSLRAFQAVKRYSIGRAGRPRFKGFHRGIHSIEGKTNQAVIRFVTSPVPAVHWAGLVLPLLLDPRDRDGWQEQALACHTKYCRILRRQVRGRTRWYVQLVQRGKPPRKSRHPTADGIVGMDLGPSTIAAVSGTDAMLEKFCPSLKSMAREARRLQRAMDRSRRATNPDNYDEEGRARKGKRHWVRSPRYLVLASQRADAERRLAAERKRAHGELANRILAQGRTIKAEKLSYKAFQRRFGRSVKRRAPGMFVSTLRRKAESAGGQVIEFSTWQTRLSQYDHATGKYKKKPLSQRWHVFPDGSRVQRDLYSAWLARFVEKDRLDASQLGFNWAAAEPLLRRAASGLNESASGRWFPLPHVPRCVGADRPSKREAPWQEARDVVALEARALETATHSSLRTPRL